MRGLQSLKLDRVVAVLFVGPLIAVFLIGPSLLAASGSDTASVSGGAPQRIAIHTRQFPLEITYAPSHSQRRLALPLLQATLHKVSDRPLSIGFYVNWDDGSYAALKRALPHIDWLIPGWLTLDGPDLRIDIEARVLALISNAKPSVQLLPMIQNAIDGEWDGSGLAKLLADPDKRTALLQEITKVVEDNRFQGVTIDFEDLPSGAHKDLQTFLSNLSARLHARGLKLVLAVPIDDPAWHYETYAALVDFVLLMAYDEHWPESVPGSVAGQNWFKEKLHKRMTRLDPRRTIVSIGNYGYDWVEGRSAEPVTYDQAMALARLAKARIEVDPQTENPHFSFIAADGKHHDVWFLNAATALNQIHAADAYSPAGYALWRLGAEDPAVWSVFGRPYGASTPRLRAGEGL